VNEIVAANTGQPTSDLLLDPDAIPWVPQADGVWFRPLRLSPGLGTWSNLLRVTRKGRINLHRHLAPVEAWVIRGQWRYLEHDWVARPGNYVYEPAGDVHTLITEGDEEMITLFTMHGPIEYIGPNGELLFTETAETKLRRYLNFCAAGGTGAVPVIG
jgi:2,4'-dihydroxyacetophenone dioxygenase